MSGAPQPNNRRERRNTAQELAREIVRRGGVPEERAISWEIAVALIPAVALFLIDKAGKNSGPLTVILLALCTGISLHATYRSKWARTAQSKKQRNGRYSVLVICVLLCVVLFGFWIWPKKSIIDEATIKAWMDDAKWHYETISTDEPDVKIDGPPRFAFALTFPNGHKILVFSGTIRPELLEVKAVVECTPDDLDMFHKFTDDQAAHVLEQIQHDLSGALGDVHSRMRHKPQNLSSSSLPQDLKRLLIDLERVVPAQGLTEMGLVDAASQVDRGIHLATTSMELAIRDMAKQP